MKEIEIVKKIMSAYKDEKGILENQIPMGVEYCSSEHADFYFYLIYNDHGTKSTGLYERFKALYENHSELFDAKYIVEKYTNKEMELYKDYLQFLGLRYPKKSTQYWIYNATKLCEEFDGDTMQLYNYTDESLQIYKSIKSFKGYGDKTTGLLLRVIDGVGFNKKLLNFEDVPLPVDTHDTKIAIKCDLIEEFDYEKADKKKLQKVSKIWQDAVNKTEYSWKELDKALWILGSVGCVSKQCFICPMVKDCKVGNAQNLLDF